MVNSKSDPTNNRAPRVILQRLCLSLDWAFRAYVFHVDTWVCLKMGSSGEPDSKPSNLVRFVPYFFQASQLLYTLVAACLCIFDTSHLQPRLANFSFSPKPSF